MDTPPVTLQTQFFSQTALTLCAAVVLLYDHIITFDIEYRRIWRRPWRKASAMFLLNRYVAFFTIPATIYTDFPPVSTPKLQALHALPSNRDWDHAAYRRRQPTSACVCPIRARPSHRGRCRARRGRRRRHRRVVYYGAESERRRGGVPSDDQQRDCESLGHRLGVPLCVRRPHLRPDADQGSQGPCTAGASPTGAFGYDHLPRRCGVFCRNGLRSVR
ncbi:hypothetical protein PsYK624_040740 [Phanerochaete sordida]|uniref:DUF6533 domain-containing protein n=1 Tax=Phanerochaete sordida TaxID=48140 RepID=A0A9P3G4B1_9APHY|nr:hypothetical protein PsYK624_040740 [Phanerochaete sordida]